MTLQLTTWDIVSQSIRSWKPIYTILAGQIVIKNNHNTLHYGCAQQYCNNPLFLLLYPLMYIFEKCSSKTCKQQDKSNTYCECFCVCTFRTLAIAFNSCRTLTQVCLSHHKKYVMFASLSPCTNATFDPLAGFFLRISSSAKVN